MAGIRYIVLILLASYGSQFASLSIGTVIPGAAKQAGLTGVLEHPLILVNLWVLAMSWSEVRTK